MSGALARARGPRVGLVNGSMKGKQLYHEDKHYETLYELDALPSTRFQSRSKVNNDNDDDDNDTNHNSDNYINDSDNENFNFVVL